MMAWHILLKDLRLELRTREGLSTMIVFALAVILLFAFAFNVAPEKISAFGPGLIWMTYFFAAVLGLLKSYGHEKEFEAFDLLLSAPIDRSVIYLGKAGAFLVLLVLTQLISLPVFMLFLEIPIGSAPGPLLIIMLLTDLAIVSVGTLIAGLALRSPSGETLLPILLFPLLTPILIAATRATRAALAGLALVDYSRWLMLQLTFSGVFIFAGLFIYDYISEQ